MSNLNSRESSDRIKSEERFHDEKYTKSNAGPSHYSLNPTSRIFTRMLEMLGDIKGKKILECGCGDGWVTAELASRGASVYAFDISSQSVKVTKALLERHGLEGNCTIEKKSMEDMDYPDESFDIVFGFAILHHVDMTKSIQQIYRILKPTGVAFFAEPLKGNPFLSLYRRLTPQYRTPDENPLMIREFSRHLTDFRNFTHEEFFLTALFPLLIADLKVFQIRSSMLDYFMRFDKFLFNNFGFLKSWAWYSILVFEK